MQYEEPCASVSSEQMVAELGEDDLWSRDSPPQKAKPEHNKSKSLVTQTL